MPAFVIAAVIGIPLALFGLFFAGVVIGATRLNHRREDRA